MRLSRWTAPIAAVSTSAALILAGIMLVRSPHVRADEGNNENSKIQIGFDIAPLPLNLAGKDHALVGLGSYIVNAGADCNGCHTTNPGTEYVNPTGNPYLFSPPFSGKTKVNPDTYLVGGNDFGPFPAPPPDGIEHLYTRNLRPDHSGLPEGGRPFSQFLDIMRHGTDYDHLHRPCTAPNTPFNCLPTSIAPFNGNLLQVMPWPTFSNMTDRDLLAIYTYLSALPCKEGPSGLDPRLYEQNVCH